MSIGLDHLQAVSTLAGDDKDRHIYGTKLDTGSCCYSNSSLPLNHIKDLNIGAFPAANCEVIAVFWIFLFSFYL